jgi:SNF2 family DNA or RNA helicase
MTTDSRHQLRQTLIAAYRQVGALEKSIVELLSVIYDAVPKTTVLNAVRKAGIRRHDGKAFSHPSLTPILENLVDQGLLEKQDNRFRCRFLLAEVVTREAVREGRFDAMAQAVEATIQTYDYGWSGHYYLSSYADGMRRLRIAFYKRDAEQTRRLLEACVKTFPDEVAHRHPYYLICDNPFDEAWLRALPDDMMREALQAILTHAATHLEPADAAVAMAERLMGEGKLTTALRQPLIEHWLLRGDSKRIDALEQDTDTAEALELRGWLAFLKGANDDAIALYEAALAARRKATRKRKIFLEGLAGVFFILALIRSGDSQRLKQAADYLPAAEKAGGRRFALTYWHLQNIVLIQQGRREAAVIDAMIHSHSLVRNINGFFYLMALYWQDAVAQHKLRKPTEELLEVAEEAGYLWVAAELAELLRRLGVEEYGARARELRERSGNTHEIVKLFERKEPWEHVLNALTELGRADNAQKLSDGQLRLVWWLKWYQNGYCTIAPREQKRDARGQWTRGRAVALKRLYRRTGQLDYLTPQDWEICSAIRPAYEGYYGNMSYEIDQRKALTAMVGHPLVFWEDSPTVPVEVVRGQPELLVTRKGSKLRIELSPPVLADEQVLVYRETPTRLKIIEIDKAHQGILAILGDGLTVPATAKDRVLDAVAGLSRVVTVQSSIGGGLESVEEVAADPTPHVHLLPFGEGLKVAILVKPFMRGGPYYRPGVGGDLVVAEVDGKRLQTKRDLADERNRVAAVIAAVPTLERLESVDGEWNLEDPEHCLEALLELQDLGDRVILEWPEGEKLKISHRASLDQFRLTIRRQQDWFGATGELRLGEDQVLDMRRLLELVQHTPSRFVPLGEGRFLALTREFRKRLDDLHSFTEPTAKGVRFHPLAALALDELTAEAGTVRSDKHWQAHIERLREVESLQPAVPSTLQAELRDYQVDGFRWLARLAYWGVGACLADDMGLGKTVQALALILTGAQDGPTLVVAPTSVCANWVDEIRRFAPTLNAIPFGGGDRQRTLAQLGPFDVMVCSYGLMQQESKQLAERYWQTIVLDEAQAIKNMATKRSQAAMTLRGGFKMLTTGTPVENHLGELWNLFRFINPGLLGSLESFNRRFATPIERDRDAAARNKLKRLIQPFILRRTKVQVLEELPPRTEILLHVEMGEDEMALYEALRRQALDKLAQTDGSKGQQQLRILAEIMKLRRACCNPRLVMPETTLPSAKLAVFREILDELLENRHKALVFSQFVDHLAIVREVLDAQGVSYQYLDGGTPAATRKKRVDAFQAGRGDVFLISLKAGGLGLNLTAADYVIHMDPWWNPAVEDQAADRAHRIGQQRPVTIYRLVVRDTIEDKIVALHQQKRDLAESLLEGAGGGGKLSVEELLRLLQDA